MPALARAPDSLALVDCGWFGPFTFCPAEAFAPSSLLLEALSVLAGPFSFDGDKVGLPPTLSVVGCAELSPLAFDSVEMPSPELAKVPDWPISVDCGWLGPFTGLVEALASSPVLLRELSVSAGPFAFNGDEVTLLLTFSVVTRLGPDTVAEVFSLLSLLLARLSVPAGPLSMDGDEVMLLLRSSVVVRSIELGPLMFDCVELPVPALARVLESPSSVVESG